MEYDTDEDIKCEIEDSSDYEAESFCDQCPSSFPSKDLLERHKKETTYWSKKVQCTTSLVKIYNAKNLRFKKN